MAIINIDMNGILDQEGTLRIAYYKVMFDLGRYVIPKGTYM